MLLRNGRSHQDCCQSHDGICYDKRERVNLTWSSWTFLGLNDSCFSDYIPLCNLIMVYYQIRDDYMNLQSDQVSLQSEIFQS
jgi:hypothetical protein